MQSHAPHPILLSFVSLTEPPNTHSFTDPNLFFACLSHSHREQLTSPVFSLSIMSGRWWTHSVGPDVLLYAVSLGYIALAPYTKVEESFNVQACHDLLEHGWQRLSLFDHLVFSGVVPRTFIGPVLLTLPLRPIYWLLRHGAGLQPMVGLYLGAYLTARTGPRALMCARIVFSRAYSLFV